MSRPLKSFSSSVTIANGASVSAAIDTKNRTLAGISTPSALTNSQIFLETSEDGVTWLPVYDDQNTRYTITVATGEARFYNLSLFQTNCLRYVRLKTTNNEGALRTFRYHVRIVR